jgi:hypothetical protein
MKPWKLELRNSVLNLPLTKNEVLEHTLPLLLKKEKELC